ncbi:MAG: chromate resistance protein ChrB domain-containing protein [Gemmatimonadaceae bacterium]
MHDAVAITLPDAEPNHNPWLLFIHAIPPKPDYLRAKIGRRLQRVGAVAVKNAVYVLPRRDESQEDFEWVLREIGEGGGEAWICEASFVDGLSNDEVQELFRTARDADYRALAEDAKALQALLGSRHSATALQARFTSELVRLQRRVNEVIAIDFFEAPGRAVVESVIRSIEQRVRHRTKRAMTTRKSRTADDEFRGRTWVTRRDVHVDRMASAWLIHRFIDAEAQFKFVQPKGYKSAPGELRFDMFQAEYTHEGDGCTFETLLARFALDDQALGALGEIVHDIDLKDARFGRDEAAGVEQLITGISLALDDDAARLERAGQLFDALYAALARKARARRGIRKRGVRKRGVRKCGVGATRT